MKCIVNLCWIWLQARAFCLCFPAVTACGSAFKGCMKNSCSRINALKKKKIRVVVFTSVTAKQLLCLLQGKWWHFPRTQVIPVGLVWSMKFTDNFHPDRRTASAHLPDCSFYSNVPCSCKHIANVLLTTKWCLIWWKEKMWILQAS